VLIQARTGYCTLNQSLPSLEIVDTAEIILEYHSNHVIESTRLFGRLARTGRFTPYP
jgi:hypothetical protein